MTSESKDPKITVVFPQDNPELTAAVSDVALQTFKDAVQELMVEREIVDTDRSVLCGMISAYIDFGTRVFGNENMIRILDEHCKQIRALNDFKPTLN